MDWNDLIKAIVAMFVITFPPDPAKILLFNSVVEKTGRSRFVCALTVATIVFAILGGAALGGSQIASLLGIDLNAFSVVGGIVVAGMGFEMLYGGGVSMAQGKEQRQTNEDESSGLVMPLAIPLIAGPGAIVTSVSIAAESADGWIMALIGCAVVALIVLVSFQWLGELLSKIPDRVTALLLRLAGLMLATIGVQMLLGGLQKFFAE